jgi:ParB family transcriptional regulator, chromosome partitioning protein
MKAADNLRARLGDHAKESMGIGREPATASQAPLPSSSASTGAAKYRGISEHRKSLVIPLDRLVPDPDQPRKEFDDADLDRLAASLKARGQLQPIRVRWEDSASQWIVVAGERRYRAAIKAGLASLLCVEARSDQSADDRLEDQLTENCIREDLKPVEQAHAFKALLERKGWSYRELAEHLHVSAAGIAQALALLKLPEPIQERVDAGALAPTVAYEIARMPDADAQVELAARVESEGMNRREATEAARRAMPKASKGGRAPKGRGIAGRVFRTSLGRVSVELKRAGDEAALIAILEEALAQQKTRVDGLSREVA